MDEKIPRELRDPRLVFAGMFIVWDCILFPAPFSKVGKIHESKTSLDAESN
jgi:hypothetical protein